MLISAVCLMDTSSVLISVKLFSFASPLFIFWYFGLYHDIRNGIKYGVYAGSAINILGCALQYAGVHLSRPILDINRAQGFFWWAKYNRNGYFLYHSSFMLVCFCC